MDRDHELERAVALELARGQRARRAATAMRDYADQRTRPGPVVLADDRDLTTEALEELADACNYVAWGVGAGEITRPKAARIHGHLLAAWRELTGT